MEGPLEYLVTQASATSCLPSNAPQDRSIAIPRTHSDLVKFAPYDAEYDKVVYVLDQICGKTRVIDAGNPKGKQTLYFWLFFNLENHNR